MDIIAIHLKQAKLTQRACKCVRSRSKISLCRLLSSALCVPGDALILLQTTANTARVRDCLLSSICEFLQLDHIVDSESTLEYVRTDILQHNSDLIVLPLTNSYSHCIRLFLFALKRIPQRNCLKGTPKRLNFLQYQALCVLDRHQLRLY